MNVPVNEMKLTIPSCSANEGFARTAVAAFAAQMDPLIEELADIKTAVSEAVTNCIVHAYREKTGNIMIECRIYSQGRLVIRVRDRGCGIPDVAKAMEPLYTTDGEERAGLGFAVMQSFMDKLRVTSAPGKGTLVVMEKIITRKSMRHE